jgi:hypothetical protein
VGAGVPRAAHPNEEEMEEGMSDTTFIILAGLHIGFAVFALAVNLAGWL